MIRINYVVEKLGDDVFIRGIGPSQPFKSMTNNELTIEELKSVSGGFSHNPEWFTGANQRRGIIHPNFIIDHGHKVGIDVGPVARVGFIVGPVSRRV